MNRQLSTRDLSSGRSFSFVYGGGNPLLQATIYKITPFDADSGYSVKFAWNGNQVLKTDALSAKAKAASLYTTRPYPHSNWNTT